MLKQFYKRIKNTDWYRSSLYLFLLSSLIYLFPAQPVGAIYTDLFLFNRQMLFTWARARDRNKFNLAQARPGPGSRTKFQARASLVYMPLGIMNDVASS